MTKFFVLMLCTVLIVLTSPRDAGAKIETVFPSLTGRSSLDHSEQTATGYEMIKNIWPGAKTLSDKSIQGWYEGRCYSRDRPNQPVASLLVVSQQDSNLHGDLKGLLSRKSIVQIMNRDARSSWFSSPSPAEIKRIEGLVAAEKNLSSFAYESAGKEFGLVADFLETETREAFRLTLRKANGRVFTSTTCMVENRCYDQSRPGRMLFVANDGENTQYCYYFRRIRK